MKTSFRLNLNILKLFYYNINGWKVLKKAERSRRQTSSSEDVSNQGQTPNGHTTDEYDDIKGF